MCAVTTRRAGSDGAPKTAPSKRVPGAGASDGAKGRAPRRSRHPRQAVPDDPATSGIRRASAQRSDRPGATLRAPGRRSRGRGSIGGPTRHSERHRGQGRAGQARKEEVGTRAGVVSRVRSGSRFAQAIGTDRNTYLNERHQRGGAFPLARTGLARNTPSPLSTVHKPSRAETVQAVLALAGSSLSVGILQRQTYITFTVVGNLIAKPACVRLGHSRVDGSAMLEAVID